MINVLGLALYGDMAASTRYRLGQFVPGLKDYDVDLKVHSLLGNDYIRAKFSGQSLPLLDMAQSAACRLRDLLTQREFDLLIVYCELFPMMPGWVETKLLRTPYLYDFDDAFYLKYRTGKFSRLRGVLGGKFDRVMERARAITAGNSTLLNYAQAQNPRSTLLPTVVDTDRYLPMSKARGREFVVGWIGSPSTAPYLAELAGPLAVLGSEGPVRLVVIGGKAPPVSNVTVDEIEWSESTEVDLINTFDVGVMPLPDHDWARGKCAFKLVQYMACALPVVASRVGANIDLVQPDCGFLATDPEEWVAALRTIRNNPKLGSTLGSAGRARVEAHYSLSHNLPILASVISQAVGRGL